MDLSLSNEINQIMSYSKDEALRLGNGTVGVEHFFLAVLRQRTNRAVDILLSLFVNIEDVKKKLENKVRTGEPLPLTEWNFLQYSRETALVLKRINLEAQALKETEVNATHLVLAILNNRNNNVSAELAAYKVNYEIFRAKYLGGPLPDFIADASSEDNTQFVGDEEIDELQHIKKTETSLGSENQRVAINTQKTQTPLLDNFGFDLTKAAAAGSLDPIACRENEIERLAQILCRRKKNNPVLIGEPGVGKSAIVEGLALQIANDNAYAVLHGKRVVSLDMASIVAGTKYRGQFEERIKGILNELRKSKNVILFIDEIHTLVGAGGAAGSLDAANMLKPALARGEIQCIGATTLDEFRNSIEKDGALERRFQKIIVSPTTDKETYEILKKIKSRYEKHHNVVYTDAALHACIKLTQRYVSDRFLPDKAIDALDEAGARARVANNAKMPGKIADIENKIADIKRQMNAAVEAKDYDTASNLRKVEERWTSMLYEQTEQWKNESAKNVPIVDEQQIAEVIAMITNVPVQRIAQGESGRLRNMAEELKGRVIGQDDAISKITRAIQRNRTGLKDPNRPIGTFIFSGPTGVGKTQLAKVLAQYLFDSSDNLIRIDMSEYMEKFAVSRLVGAPPGYVGYEEGGQLTEKVRRKPYCVVLLDEIEKAHPDVFNILLQLLDEGMLTDSLGRKVDFKNTIIIMTSNIGSREVKELGQGVGYSSLTNSTETLQQNTRSIIQKSLERTFAPEFLNRIDDIIMFNTLTRENIHDIIDIELKQLFDRIGELGYKIELSEKAKDFIADKGFSREFGARPLKRAIQQYIEDAVAEVIIQQNPAIGSIIKIDLNKAGDNVIVKLKKMPEMAIVN